jgi:hypothetical protein
MSYIGNIVEQRGYCPLNLAVQVNCMQIDIIGISSHADYNSGPLVT